MARGWDDDWTGGEPPEGRHTRDQARPDFWRNQRAPALITGTMGLVLLIIVVLVVVLA